MIVLMPAPNPWKTFVVVHAEDCGDAGPRLLAESGACLLPGAGVTAVFEGLQYDPEVPLRAVRALLKLALTVPGTRAGAHAGDSRDPAIVAGLAASARALAGAAEPGVVLVSKAVERAVPRRFRFHELPIEVGHPDPVVPYEVVEAVGAPGEFGSREELGELTGRDAELARLMAAVGGARIAVEGPAGSGRSRLLREVRDRARAGRPDMWIAVGRCESRPPARLGPFGEVIRAEAMASGFDRWDWKRVLDAVERLAPPGEAVAGGHALAIARDLGERVEGSPSAAPTIPAWRAVLGAAAARGGVLLCIEDFERADAGTRALVDGLADLPGLCLLVTALPGAGPAGCERITLPPRPLPAVDLASLDAETRETLVAAAVLGRTFWKFAVERLLVREVDEAFEEARRRGLILFRQDSLMGAEGQAMFRHLQIRQAVEDLASPAEKARFHAGAAHFYGQRVKFGGPAIGERERWHRERGKETTGEDVDS